MAFLAFMLFELILILIDLVGGILYANLAAAATAVDALGGPLAIAATPRADAADPEDGKDAAKHKLSININIHYFNQSSMLTRRADSERS